MSSQCFEGQRVKKWVWYHYGANRAGDVPGGRRCVVVGNDLQSWYGLFRVSLCFPWVVHMSDTPSEDDYEGASLWNGIAKDICPLVKGGVAFADRVSRPDLLLSVHH